MPGRYFAVGTEFVPGFVVLVLGGLRGGSACGDFLQTLIMTDVFSGWIALGAMKGRGEMGTLEAIKSASWSVPFR